MINLPGGYAMDADDYCYIIGKPYRNPKDGKITLAKKTYYTKLEDALDDVVRRCGRDRVAEGSIDGLLVLKVYLTSVACDLKRALKPVDTYKITPEPSLETIEENT